MSNQGQYIKLLSSSKKQRSIFVILLMIFLSSNSPGQARYKTQTTLTQNKQIEKPQILLNSKISPKDFLGIWEESAEKPGKNRPVTRGDEVCLIAPSETIWTQRPRFIWKGIVQKVDIIFYRSERLVSQLITNVTNQKENTASSEIAKKDLDLGKEYGYRMEYQTKNNQNQTVFMPTRLERFKVMASGKERQEINAALAEIDRQVPVKTPNWQEQVALQKAMYFLKQGKESDALQFLFSVEKPSKELQSIQKKISDSLCPGSKAN